MIRKVPANSINFYDVFFKNFFDSNAQFSILEENTKISYPVDISTTDSELVFEIACVGVDKEDLEIIRTPDSLRVKYNKTSDKSPDVNYIYRSISKKSFDFGWTISAKYDLEKMEASLDKGLLTIKIPLKEGHFNKVEIQ
jgi:HSP20 family molecular chaperone IbpA